MQITVFGASGKVGRLVVAEALARGHSVVGFTHSHTSFKHHAQLRILQGDVHNSRAVANSLRGSEAVISVLGSWGTPTKDIVAAGIRSIIPAMQAQQISRVVSLTGAEAHDTTDHPMFWRRLSHFGARIAARKILHDGEEHIRLLRASGLDWTVLRSPVMTGKSDIFYRLTLKPLTPWQTIPRCAVAKALVDQLEGPGYINAAPFIKQ